MSIAKGDYVESVMWNKFGDNYYLVSSKSHYMVRNSSKTICGVSLPSRNEADCEQGGTVDCKRCVSIFNKKDLNHE